MNNPNPKKRLWLSISLVSLCLVGGMLLLLFLKQKASVPLGPALSLPTTTLPGQSEPTPGMDDGQEPDGEGDEGKQVEGEGKNDEDSGLQGRGKPVCGGPESLLILGVGTDSASYRYGLADVIRIVRLDFVDKRITAVSLPRDLWIEMPDIGLPPSYTHGKINQAYLFGMLGMGYYQGADAGAGTLARAIQHNYGLRVDHYAAVNMPVFVSLVDAMGGVTVELPYDIYIGGRLENGILYPAGRQHFDGASALRFARTRSGYSDFFRQDNQSLLIKAMARRVLSPAIFPKIPALVSVFKDQVLTDLSLEQISQAVCLLSKVEPGDIVLTQLPEEMLSIGSTYSPIFRANTSIVSADPQEVRRYLARFAAGEWPD